VAGRNLLDNGVKHIPSGKGVGAHQFGLRYFPVIAFDGDDGGTGYDTVNNAVTGFARTDAVLPWPQAPVESDADR
jgi:hypothetical protein